MIRLPNLPKITPSKTSGQPPGSLIFTGTKRSDAVHVHLMRYGEEAYTEQDERDAVPDPEDGANLPVRWLDVRGLHNEQLIERIGRRNRIHSLVLEDILDVRQRPKFDEYEDGFFLQMRAFHFDAISLEIKTEQVSIYVTEGRTFSFQEDTTDLFAVVRERIRTGRGKVRFRGADYLAYALADALVDSYFTIMDQVEELMEALEDEIMDDPEENLKQRIHHLRLQMLTLRKSVAPLREAVSKFSKSDHKLIEDRTYPFVRDLYDHTVQIADSIDTQRDVLNGLYDLYLSEISFRMNNVMQVLTIISTIFIPLTFLAGIYGMNFVWIPELQYKYGYPILLALMLLITVALIGYFRRKRWL